ncbi:MAG: FKBP-type peptidyl-prolyl cis-trans isomerase [Caldimicrobium sp.]|nr:FKBP-type peptidyl-prolyl cis-trans isomerase [Caldimicrobium sp.]
MKIEKDAYVRLRYSLEIVGEKTPSWFSKPYEVAFIMGREVIPAVIEKAIEGKSAGEKVEVIIPHQSAYGPHLSYLVKEISLESLKHPEKIIPGEWYEEVSPYGSRTFFKVLDVKDGKVKADFNHPAAGKEVAMKIDILEARPATAYEIMAAELRACGGG